MDLQVGQRITAPFLSVSAEVKKFEPRTGYYLLEVVLQDGHHTYKPLRITEDQLAQIQILERGQVALTGNAEDFFFLIEAHRIRLACQFDPQLAVSVPQVDPLPHQIEAVYRYVLNTPRIRFLIADDPDAAYIIVEVKADNQVVAPVVQAKKGFAQQMAVASGMTYHIIKASDANQGLYTHLLDDTGQPIQPPLAQPGT